jgi:general secretion pathway protein K
MKSPFKNNKGVALLMAMFSMMIMVVIAVQVTERSTVEYLISSRNINRLRAYYAAKAGVDMGLLRILLFKKAQGAVGDKMGEQKSLLNMIWQTPMVWPPQMPDNSSAIAKDTINKSVKESIFKNQYMVTIENEDAKIDINELGSMSKALAQATSKQILKIFISEVENNDDFSDKYRDFDFEELIQNITDWVDEDEESLTGSSERSGYEKYESEFIPPNQAFKTMQEMKMVKGMNDDLYRILKNKVTVFGAKGVNINFAEKDVVKSLDPQITDEIVEEFLKRRNDPDKGPFKNAEDLENFFSENRVSDFNKDGIPIFFDTEYNFRIKSMGQYSNLVREIEVVTYDFDGIKEGVIATLKKEDDEKNSSNGDDTSKSSTQDNQTASKESSSDEKKVTITYKGRPQIVYWWEN